MQIFSKCSLWGGGWVLIRFSVGTETVCGKQRWIQLAVATKERFQLATVASSSLVKGEAEGQAWGGEQGGSIWERPGVGVGGRAGGEGARWAGRAGAGSGWGVVRGWGQVAGVGGVGSCEGSEGLKRGYVG